MEEVDIVKKLYQDPNLQIIFSVTLMAVLGVASLAPAFPIIAKELAVSKASIGLLITVFTLPGVILTPVFGVMADRYGRKRILVPSLMLFGIAGAACGFARDFDLLLMFRFFQGVGAASLGSLNVTIIGDLYSGKERSAVMGYNASVLSLGTAIYPALGGALAMLGWYYPFFLPVVAIPIGLVVLFSLNNPEPRNEQSLTTYLNSAWKSIRNRQVFGLFIASIVTFIILYGSYLTFFSILIEDKFNVSPIIIGLIMASMALTTAITSSQLGKLVKILPEKTLMRVSFILYALALVSIPDVSDLTTLLIPTMVFGIAHGINIPTIHSMLAGLAPMEYRAAFMSVNGMVLRLGQTLGPLIMGAVFVFGGLDGVFYAGAGFAIGMVMVLMVLVK
ncbi:MAG: MFS transporter [Nitrospirae bacterium]|nr:MFS transporter [Nitrospirota bacterium]